jgi:hypothetical protein
MLLGSLKLANLVQLLEAFDLQFEEVAVCHPKLEVAPKQFLVL